MASSLSKMKKLTLLPRIIIAILLGVLLGQWMPEAGVRVFVTYNYLFSQFLGFLIPLIIIGLIVPAISEIGQSAGRLLLLTVGLAYADTIIAGLLGGRYRHYPLSLTGCPKRLISCRESRQADTILHTGHTTHTGRNGSIGQLLRHRHRHCL